MESADPRACPPHHWTVTTARIGDEACYHHTCLRCGAQKDTPLYAATSTWRPERGRGATATREAKPEAREG